MGVTTELEARELFKKVDVDSNGYLNFPELYKSYRGAQLQEIKFQELWDELDKDGNRKTTVAEALPLIRAIEDGMSLEEA